MFLLVKVLGISKGNNQIIFKKLEGTLKTLLSLFDEHMVTDLVRPTKPSESTKVIERVQI